MEGQQLKVGRFRRFTGKALKALGLAGGDGAKGSFKVVSSTDVDTWKVRPPTSDQMLRYLDAEALTSNQRKQQRQRDRARRIPQRRTPRRHGPLVCARGIDKSGVKYVLRGPVSAVAALVRVGKLRFVPKATWKRTARAGR